MSDWAEGFQQAQGQAAIRSNGALRQTVGNYASALDQANNTIDQAQHIITTLNGRISTLNKVVELRTAEAADFRLKLIVETAHAAGLTVHLNAFKAAHPDSPVMADSGRRYADGDIKTMGRTLYEDEFDRIITRHNLERPTDYRAD